MKIQSIILSVVFSLVCFGTNVFCQTELRLNRLSGISSSEKVSEILFDTKNNLWVSGSSGIYTYDSNDKHSKKHDKSNSIAIDIDSSGNYYSAYQDNSLYFNKEQLYKLEDRDAIITDIQSYNGSLWVSTNKGLYEIDIEKRDLKRRHTTKNSKLVTNKINFLYSDKAGILWIGTEKGAIRIRKDKWSKCLEVSHNMLAITEHYDLVWLVSDKEMWEIEPTESSGRELGGWYPAAPKRGLYKGAINDLVIDNLGFLYIASDVLIRFNPSTNKIEEYGKSLGLVSKKCLTLECDNENNIYLGTENAGLFKISTEVIEVEELTAVAILENPINCPGGMDGSILLETSGGQAPLQYFWSPANVKGTNPQKLKKGTYTVTVVDAFKNEIIKSITIEEPNPIKVDVISKSRISSAGKKDGKCNIQVTGGNAPYKVRWDNKEKGLEAKKLNYGIHIINVTDANGCTNSATVEIEKEKFLPELDIANIKVGQTLRINNLYFDADSEDFNDVSRDVLIEIYEFMSANENVVIEIGGHTNNIPSHEYCDKLSSSRASNVAKFLVDLGLKNERVKNQGYGKRKPIASNETQSGRQRNQRVEIKILQIESK